MATVFGHSAISKSHKLHYSCDFEPKLHWPFTDQRMTSDDQYGGARKLKS